MRPDPYAAHDPVLTRRFAGLMQLLTGGALLLVVLVSGSREEAVGTLMLAGFAALTGAALLRGWAAGYDTLLALTYVNLAGLITLSAIPGPHATGLDELYLGVLLSAAALHPPRRVVPVFLLLTAGIAVEKWHGGFTAAELVDMAVHLTIFFFVAAMSTVTVRDLREQRLLAQREGEAARRQALTDPLTGLGNRRRLLADLDAAVASSEPAVLAIFDLDGFKAYNDTFGHPAGDALLRRLADRLAEAVDGDGEAYRMGGDEFCVLLAVTGAERGPAIARAVEALSERGESFSVRSSHGVIDLPDEARTAAEALRIADRRMYACKSAGAGLGARGR
jgi:diguanylate cyclase (GGDEF)-like protein